MVIKNKLNKPMTKKKQGEKCYFCGKPAPNFPGGCVPMCDECLDNEPKPNTTKDKRGDSFIEFMEDQGCEFVDFKSGKSNEEICEAMEQGSKENLFKPNTTKTEKCLICGKELKGVYRYCNNPECKEPEMTENENKSCLKDVNIKEKDNKKTESEWKETIRSQVNNAWNRGSNWACKGFGYAMDTDAEREIETITELVSDIRHQARHQVIEEVRKGMPKKRREGKHDGHNNDDRVWCYVCCEADEESEFTDNGEYNKIIDQLTQLLTKLDKEK